MPSDKNSNVSGVVKSELHDWPNYFFLGHARAPTPLCQDFYWHDMARHDTIGHDQVVSCAYAGQIDYFLIWPTKGKGQAYTVGSVSCACLAWRSLAGDCRSRTHPLGRSVISHYVICALRCPKSFLPRLRSVGVGHDA